MYTIDFETEAIVGNPLLHPPAPVGVAVKHNDKPSKYFTGDAMLRELSKVWASCEGLVFQNAPFDLSVAGHHLGLSWPTWERVHETQYLIYLYDPHAPNLSLKPSAGRILDWDVSAKDELQEWVMKHIKKATKRSWGAHISKAPVDLVARYACDDVDMTWALYDYLLPRVPKEAYNRERELMPYLVDATQQGIRVATGPLELALERTESAMRQVTQQVYATLGVGEFNVQSGAELASALEQSGKMLRWVTTPTGKKSTARANLIAGIDDTELLQKLVYLGSAQTAVGTFMKPWLLQAEATGRLNPNWNQIKTHEGTGRGTRTGRLSSNGPNFQNVPNPFEVAFYLPNLRDFLLPEEGHVWVSSDFKSQEMRILAHYEDGILADSFRGEPDLDPHAMVQELIREKTGQMLKRKHVKNIGFGIMYGMGVGALCKQLGVDRYTAMEMRKNYMAALPGIDELQILTRQMGKNRLKIKTWGGREYLAEDNKVINGELRTYEYKLLNYLIQGSAADQTKQCIIDWHKHKGKADMFLATVHDEINISVPEEDLYRGKNILEEVMCEPMGTLPMRCDTTIGDTWGSAI